MPEATLTDLAELLTEGPVELKFADETTARKLIVTLRAGLLTRGLNVEVVRMTNTLSLRTRGA